MSQTVPASTLKYSPDVEKPEPDEAETFRELVATMRSISEKTFGDGGHALRSVHAKSHGLLTGELTVPDGLPAPLRQGLFAVPGAYSAVLRLSTSPGDLLDDNVSTPRGLAIKIAGIKGERLPGSEGATTQDFVLVNGPAFSSATPKKFLGNLKMLAKTTDKAEGLKKLASAALRGLETVVEAVGGKSPTLTTLGGQRETHILGETFFSQAPIRYGDYIAKIALVPVSPELTRLTDQPLDLNNEPDGLRAAVVDFFHRHDATWEVRVQLCTGLEAMPVEDASVVWPEDQSPYIAVARLTVPRQDAWGGDRIQSINEDLSFSPWHGLIQHRPLGGVMRARKPAYEMSARFRADHGASIKEPSSKAEMPA